MEKISRKAATPRCGDVVACADQAVVTRSAQAADAPYTRFGLGITGLAPLIPAVSANADTFAGTNASATSGPPAAITPAPATPGVAAVTVARSTGAPLQHRALAAELTTPPTAATATNAAASTATNTAAATATNAAASTQANGSTSTATTAASSSALTPVERWRLCALATGAVALLCAV